MVIAERRARERLLRRERIVDAARTLAEREGWDAVTTRRLADTIEYSQPVLYSHFANKDAIVAAVAVEGFAELATELRRAHDAQATPTDGFRALAGAYLAFASAKPALYDAMFRLASLPFAKPEAPEPLHDAFAVLREAVAPMAGDRDPGLLAEIAWSALHGVATLGRGGRLGPDADGRLVMLTDLFVTR